MSVRSVLRGTKGGPCEPLPEGAIRPAGGHVLKPQTKVGEGGSYSAAAGSGSPVSAPGASSLACGQYLDLDDPVRRVEMQDHARRNFLALARTRREEDAKRAASSVGSV